MELILKPGLPTDPRVLLIEDNPGDVFLVRDVLTRGLPCELEVAPDGARAVDRLFESDGSAKVPVPDLIILDLNLPKISGHEVLQKLKTSLALRSVPIVVFSSSEAPEDIRSAYDGYANCYVRKPMRLDEFFNVILAIERFWFRVVKLPAATAM